MSNSKLKEAMLVVVSLLPFFIGAIISLVILPENCSLLGNSEGPFSCDSIPNNCCNDKMTTTYAQIALGLGLGLTIAASVKRAIKDSQSHSNNQLKIFD